MSQSIFRYIELHTGETISLGAPIPPDAQPLLTPDGDGRWIVKPEDYSGAAAITVVVGDGDAVQRMEFTYAAGTDYSEMLENFEQEIGPPDRQQGNPPARQSTWQDSETRFVLSEQSAGPGSPMGSTLSNLAGVA